MNVAPTDQDQKKLFQDLAWNITNPGTTNIVVEEAVESCFRVTALSAPTKGTGILVGDRTVAWSIPEIGITQSEGVSLTFEAENNSICFGTLAPTAGM